jgi:hypothetical protein
MLRPRKPTHRPGFAGSPKNRYLDVNSSEHEFAIAKEKFQWLTAKETFFEDLFKSTGQGHCSSANSSSQQPEAVYRFLSRAKG